MFNCQSERSLRIVLPALLSVFISGLLLLTLQLAAGNADRVASDREKDLLLLTVSKLKAAVAHDQESVTIWDDAVLKTSHRNRDWIEANLGSWMHSYFHHDAAIVLDNELKPIHQFIADTNLPPRSDDLENAYLPLATRLRERLIGGDNLGVSESVLSIGEADLTYVGFRPAIVSVKPIMSDSGKLAQIAGQENLHVSIRFLDSDLPVSIGREYQFSFLSFSVQQPRSSDKSFVALKGRDGAIVGHFQWAPFAPGKTVISASIPALAGIMAALFCLFSAAGGAVWRRSARLVSSQEALRYQANHDGLTGLMNRSAFNDELSTKLKSSGAETKHCVLFVDLDRFKHVNDTFGHPTGDKLIQLVATRMSSLLPSATIGRIGGDEFVIHLEKTSIIQAAEIAEGIVTCLNRPFEVDSAHVVIGASIGAASIEGRGDAIELTRQADIALYHAKASGRNRYAVFGKHMDEMLCNRRILENDLRSAIESGEQIEVHYQPVYTADGRGPCSLEALIRWTHPTLGNISPAEFIPIAEEVGLVQEIGCLVLADACCLLAEIPHVTVSINASARELESASYPLRVLTELAKWRIQPNRLEIEFTESAAVGDNQQLESGIKILRKAGVKIAIDDFGTGYSNIARVHQFEVDRLKIDKSFVADMEHKDSLALVSAIISLAQAKGLLITAEGVETADQQEKLRTLGCDHLQGFHLSKPLPRSVVLGLFRSEFSSGSFPR